LGWLVGSSEAKKVPGLVRFFWGDFLIVFLNSPHRETPKNVIKKIEKKLVWDFVVDFFEKVFDTVFWKTFFVVFLNSHR